MFTVTGTHEGVAYTAVLGSDEPTAPGDTVGCATGSPGILALVALSDGEKIKVTPTGPAYVVDIRNAESVYALLLARTTVSDVTGDAPTIIEPTVANAAY